MVPFLCSVGIAGAVAVSVTPPEGHFGMLSVAPPYQGRGIARELVQAAAVVGVVLVEVVVEVVEAAVVVVDIMDIPTTHMKAHMQAMIKEDTLEDTLVIMATMALVVEVMDFTALALVVPVAEEEAEEVVAVVAAVVVATNSLLSSLPPPAARLLLVFCWQRETDRE